MNDLKSKGEDHNRDRPTAPVASPVDAGSGPPPKPLPRWNPLYWMAGYLGIGAVLLLLTLFAWEPWRGLFVVWLLLTLSRWPLCLPCRPLYKGFALSCWWLILLLTAYFYVVPLVVRAHYAANADPAVGDLRTQIELYRQKFGQWPGLANTIGNKEGAKPGAEAGAFKQTGLQTFLYDEESQTSGIYQAALWDIAKGRPVPMEDPIQHFSGLIGRTSSDFIQSGRLHPNHVFYRAFASTTHTGTYLHVVGVFGDGNGLKAGTGYAVLEMANPATQTRIIAVWRRMKPALFRAKQIIPVSAAEHPFHATEIQNQNVCWIGDPEALLSQDWEIERAELDKLRQAGWQL
jgi:energy-coupling factor transporter transmembrane protein EcfT